MGEMKRFLFALAFVAVSCSSMKEGIVVNKFIEPANHYYAWIPIQTGTICTGGKYPSCTPIFTLFPFRMYDDEDYVIVLEDCKDGGCKRGNRHLAKEEYDRTPLNEFWSEEGNERWVMEDKDVRERKAKRSEMPPNVDAPA